MNIPNDGGWGKFSALNDLNGAGQENGLLGHFSAISRDWVMLGCLALTATFALGAGLYIAPENQPSKDPLWIEQLPPEELPGSIGTSTNVTVQESSSSPVTGQTNAKLSPPAAAAALPKTGQYVASKTGSKYYLPNCATAKRIKDEKKVWFATKQAAEAAGYQPAANCKGL